MFIVHVSLLEFTCLVTTCVVCSGSAALDDKYYGIRKHVNSMYQDARSTKKRCIELEKMLKAERSSSSVMRKQLDSIIEMLTNQAPAQ